MVKVYEFHMDEHEGFIDEPVGSLTEKYRKVEYYRLNDDVEVHTRLIFDEAGFHPRDLQPSPAIPTLRGTIILVSYLYSIDSARDVYGRSGIAAIQSEPFWEPDHERLRCNMNYLRYMVRQIRRLPRQE
jgi:hypothetical protein